MSKIKDIVCGMYVDSETAKHYIRHEELDYCFCSAECATKFAADPEKYGHPGAVEHGKAHQDGPAA